MVELAELLNRSFVDYPVRVLSDGALLAEKIRIDGIDLKVSRVVVAESAPVGLVLLARRGWTTRVATMGLVPPVRGRGVGRWLMKRLLAQARRRGDRRLVLEVIERDTAAFRLYDGFGFRVDRRLVGYSLNGGAAACGLVESIERIDIRRVGEMLTTHASQADLPWQVSGDTIAQWSSPAEGYRLGPGCAVISDPHRELVSIKALAVRSDSRRQGWARRLIQALLARFPGKIWKIPVLTPEELGAGMFENLGFEKQRTTQLQMSLDLVRPSGT
ncbi:MAG: GNAT family N-acetyltransferase [bacterium]|nr:GNAT family N-acetyltransferase [bacterium]